MTAVAVLRDAPMNREEAARAEALGLLQAAGRIRRYDFQPEKLRLAKSTFYTPDFRVILPDWSIEFEDVKGRKGARYWCEEDAKVKIKLAAELHPYRFAIVWRLSSGLWQREAF